jgi:hypothetical protein
MDTAQETMYLFLSLIIHGSFPKLLPAHLSGNTLLSRTRLCGCSSLAPCPLPGDPFSFSRTSCGEGETKSEIWVIHNLNHGIFTRVTFQSHDSGICDTTHSNVCRRMSSLRAVSYVKYHASFEKWSHTALMYHCYQRTYTHTFTLFHTCTTSSFVE